MDSVKLKRLFYLNKELIFHQEQLQVMKRLKGVEAKELEKKIRRLEDKIIKETDEIMDFIENITDPLTRLIFEYKYIRCMKWQQIANRIGTNTADSCRKIHDRYLKRGEHFGNR